MRSLLAGTLLMVTLSLCAAATVPQRHVLIVIGLGGEPQYTKVFNQWAAQMREIAERALAIPNERITVLGASTDDAATSGVQKSEVIAALHAVATASAEGDLVMLLLIGHGTARDGKALFNLPGPDLSATELHQALEQLAGRSLVVVNAASSSGAFVRELSAPGRVVITATASGSEFQFAHFGGQFVSAFVAPAADSDKDGRVSMLEAFQHARKSVARNFEEDERILTEHALLDDDGDGVGSRLTEADPSDGALAAKVFLQPSVGELAADAAQARAMLALDVKASELVNRIDRLKRKRAQLLDDEYFAELESVLVTLAYNRRALRELADEDAASVTQ